jgi:parallel beta-helix repeat protein
MLIIGLLCFSTISSLSVIVPQAKAEIGFSDFETGFNGWEPFTINNGTAQRDSSYSHSGSYSVEQVAETTGSDPESSYGGIRFPVTTTSSHYALSCWVYVTQRSDAMATTYIGFYYPTGPFPYREDVSWNAWGDGSSYVDVRQSEGYAPKLDVPYGLTLNTWHHAEIVLYTDLGTASIWLDGSQIVNNWPAFNPGDKPDCCFMAGSAAPGGYAFRQYVDDVATSDERLPVGYWKFDEGSGDIAYDSAGTNNGIIRGVPAWTTGIVGEALRFDGAQNNYVALSSQLNVNDAMTVEVWVYPEFDPTNPAAYPQQFGCAGRQIVRKSSVADDTFYLAFYSGYYFNQTNPVPRIQVGFYYQGGGNVGLVVSIPGLISEGQWYHLAAVFKRNDYARLYVNGVEEVSNPTEDKPLRVSSRRLTIGQEADIVGGDPVDTPSTPQTWIGKIDEVKIYNYARTAEEIWHDSGPYVHNLNTGLDYVTIQAAIDAPETLDGHTILADKGIYQECVVINKSISLVGEDRDLTVIDGSNSWPLNVTADGVTITGFTMTHFSRSLWLTSVHNCTISNNTIESSFDGIEVDGHSTDITISYNLIRNNTRDGMYVAGLNHHIYNNTVLGNGNYGLLLQIDVSTSIRCSGCVVEKNNFLQNGWQGSNNGGIMLDRADNSTISKNAISQNSGFGGICLLNGCCNNSITENYVEGNSYGIRDAYDSRDNRIYHNCFDGNTYNALTLTSVDTWDDGYPSGGNYWSDYAGVDLFWGPSQNLTGSDGIGDTVYAIGPNNVDHYPLTSRWAAPDIAIPYLSTSKTGCSPMPTVGKNYIVSINITINNEGRTLQIFNITASANSTEIGRTLITLSNGSSTNVVMIWNTTGFDYGDYNITVNVEPLLGELVLGDNAKGISKLIRVTVPGDVDGNSVVSIMDVVKITSSYMAKRGQPAYNSNADINDDGVINILDVVICTSHYGQHHP